VPTASPSSSAYYRRSNLCNMFVVVAEMGVAYRLPSRLPYCIFITHLSISIMWPIAYAPGCPTAYS